MSSWGTKPHGWGWPRFILGVRGGPSQGKAPSRHYRCQVSCCGRDDWEVGEEGTTHHGMHPSTFYKVTIFVTWNVSSSSILCSTSLITVSLFCLLLPTIRLHVCWRYKLCLIDLKIGDYPGGPNVITKVLKNGRVNQVIERCDSRRIVVEIQYCWFWR